MGPYARRAIRRDVFFAPISRRRRQKNPIRDLTTTNGMLGQFWCRFAEDFAALAEPILGFALVEIIFGRLCVFQDLLGDEA